MRPVHTPACTSTYGKALRKHIQELQEEYEERMAKMETYTLYLAEQLDKAISYSETIAEELNKLMERNETK